MNISKPFRVCVYCGSSPLATPQFIEEAKLFGKLLAQNNIELVYGGATIGLMGAVADGVLEEGGKVIGVLPEFLQKREIAHVGTELHIVQSMHERKNMMAELSDAFVALPGGYGTFEEIFEIITWVQLGLINSRCIFLNLGGYYDPIVSLIENSIKHNFVTEENKNIVEMYNSVEKVISTLLRK